MALIRILAARPHPHLAWGRYGGRRVLSVASSPLTKFFKVSEEVRAALTTRKPGKSLPVARCSCIFGGVALTMRIVVALESAIYTHGQCSIVTEKHMVVSNFPNCPAQASLTLKTLNLPKTSRVKYGSMVVYPQLSASSTESAELGWTALS